MKFLFRQKKCLTTLHQTLLCKCPDFEMFKVKSGCILDPHAVLYWGVPVFDGVSAPCHGKPWGCTNDSVGVWH